MRASDLGRERWRRIDEVFDAALDRPPDERSAFLDVVCAGDDELRREVESLLDARRRGADRFDPPVSAIRGAILSTSEERPERLQVGPFRLLREIGRGGMGVVYLAEDTRLGRRVALKVLPPYLGVGPEAKRRFQAEARAVSTLDHPNIATLHEIDETEEGQLFMVFAFYEGETLADRIAHGRVPVADAIEIALRIGDGLAAAHRNGIVHRDVKPSNVLLTTAGEVKLLDFGVAKVAGEELTGEGIRVGTVSYMSPEQVDGEALDARSDLWSLGVVLYEMLTGDRPFRGDSPATLFRSILHDRPQPFGSVADARTATLERIVIDGLLCRAPEGRYQTAEELAADLRALQVGDPASVAIRAPPSRRPSRHPARRWALPILVGSAVLAGTGWVASHVFGEPRAQIERVAVLPLEDLTGDSAEQHFIDGIQGELIAELGTIQALSVLSRTSVLRYRAADTPLPQVARELNVDAVVTGSVFRHGDSVEIAAELTAASPERQLWAETYRGTVGDVVTLAGQAAQSIATQIASTPTPANQPRRAAASPVDPAAYDAFTLGQFNLERRSREGFDLAERYFRRAIEIDSSFAPPYAALADAYGSATYFGLAAPAENLPEARTLAEKALALDGTLPEARTVLAGVKLYWDWDWAGAEREARQAVALNPSYPPARRILSEVLSTTGRHEEALAQVERASQTDRFVPFSAFRPAVVLGYMRDYDAAIERTREGLSFFTDFWQGHWLLCQFLSAKGLDAEAIPECEQAVENSGRTPMALGTLGYVYASSGRTAEARQLLAELQDQARVRYVGAIYIATVYVGLGDHDQALKWLDVAYRERDMDLVHIADSPVFDRLRTDPGFETLLRNVGLPPTEDQP